MNIPIFTTFVAFALIFAFVRKKNDFKSKNIVENFWENEEKANAVRRQSLDSLPYIIIPVSKLPITETDDPDIERFQKEIDDLSDRKIVNLSGFTNTELKFKYGAANLNELMLYDECFTRLAKVLCNWGETLSSKGMTDEAITVLEFGVTCGTDIVKNYTLLAQLYKFTDDPSKISALTEAANNINSPRKSAIIDALKDM